MITPPRRTAMQPFSAHPMMIRVELVAVQDFRSAWSRLPVIARGVLRFFGWLDRLTAARPGHS